MFIDLSPLKKHRDFRLLFAGQMVSFLGSMISFVAIPYQIFELTKDNWLVGMLGIAQLGPILLFGVIGGSFADKFDRRKILIYSEIFMALCALGLSINSLYAQPSVTMIFLFAAAMQAANGFHRPAMDAMTQKMVDREDYPAISALGSFRFSFGAIVGPAIGGILIASFGAQVAHFVDFLTFLFAIVSLSLIRSMPPVDTAVAAGFAHILEGFRFAWKRPELVGTYITDIVAMAFAFPTALFPAMSENWGGATAAGALFSAMAVGSLFITIFSGWMNGIKRHGLAVILAAFTWGLAVIALGFAPDLTTALICLGLAGAADMVSGMFRGIIWNETIPNEMRGRLAGLEMISYMSGPLIGNARAGWVASMSSISLSIWSGGVICSVGVIVCGLMLPGFRRYVSKTVNP
ncbi:MAG: MFS transporter [Bdellovibrionia bacterium]